MNYYCSQYRIQIYIDYALAFHLCLVRCHFHLRVVSSPSTLFNQFMGSHRVAWIVATKCYCLNKYLLYWLHYWCQQEITFKLQKKIDSNFSFITLTLTWPPIQLPRTMIVGILEDAIAILGTSVDVHDIPNLRNLFRKTFTMLKCLAKENPMVHRRLFEHIDLFLGINGCVVEMTELLVEVI